MAEDQLRLAFLGCGNIANAHWYGIQRHAPRIKITACIDSDIGRAEEMAQKTGSAAFESLDSALKQASFDAVDIMLPHDAHLKACYEAYNAQKHVLLEKPIARTIAEAEKILQGAQVHGLKLMVAEQAQYWTDVIRAREIIDEGEIGEVISGRACFYDPLRRNPDEPLPWRFSLGSAGGGISIDGGAHWIRPMRMMLGEIHSVIAATSRHIEEMEGESLAHAIFRFESGVFGSFQALQSVAPVGPIEDFRITGTDGELIIERGRHGRLMLYNREHESGMVVMSAFEGKAASYGVELHDFSCHVLDDSELAAPPEFALGELRTALAMYRSVQSGTWENVWA